MNISLHTGFTVYGAMFLGAKTGLCYNCNAVKTVLFVIQILKLLNH